MSDNVEIRTLDNGLTVVVDTNTNVSSVVVSLGVKVGSRNEQLDQGGIAHFLEHMCFKGTNKRTCTEIMDSIESLGGYFNAYTSQSQTVYYTKLLSEHLEIGIDVISDMVLNSQFPEDEFAKEKNVVIQEIKRAEDDPSRLLHRAVFSNIFTDQALGRATLGTEDQIRNYGTSDLKRFHDAYYVPENMVYSFAGNVTMEQVLPLLENLFVLERTLEENHAENNEIFHEPAIFSEHHIMEHKSELQQGNVYMLWKVTDEISLKENIILKFLSSTFGGGMSSRLFKKIREEMGLVYSVSSGYMSYSDLGMFYIAGGTSLDRVNDFVTESCKLLKGFKGGVTDLELTRSLNMFKTSLLTSKENNQSVATGNISELFEEGRLINEKEIVDIIENITKEDLDTLTQKILDSQFTLGVLGDFDNEVKKEDIINLDNVKTILQ